MVINSVKKAQIKSQVKTLLFDEVFTFVLVKYSNYSHIFLVENIMELLKNIKINYYVIKLEESKQPIFCTIYSLRLIKFKILKIYIQINLANSFIWPSKSFIRALIFFNQKPDESLRVCIDYWSLNNFTIKIKYLLSCIEEFLN